jgi:ComF family protein
MLKSFLSLFLKSSCPLCQRSANEIICSYCDRNLQTEKLDRHCQYWQGDLPLFAWGKYGGQLKRAIAAMKYESHPELGELMGTWLAKAWLSSDFSKKSVKQLTIVPIPLYQQKLQERGFNQAEVVAKSFCQITGYILQKQGLQRNRDTKPMFGLDAIERQKNIQGALEIGKDFQIRKPISPVLLVDDIYTKGTTVTEARKVLADKGIKVFGVVAVSVAKNNSDQ